MRPNSMFSSRSVWSERPVEVFWAEIEHRFPVSIFCVPYPALRMGKFEENSDASNENRFLLKGVVLRLWLMIGMVKLSNVFSFLS